MLFICEFQPLKFSFNEQFFIVLKRPKSGDRVLFGHCLEHYLCYFHLVSWAEIVGGRFTISLIFSGYLRTLSFINLFITNFYVILYLNWVLLFFLVIEIFYFILWEFVRIPSEQNVFVAVKLGFLWLSSLEVTLPAVDPVEF